MIDFQDRYIPEPTTGCWLWLGSNRGFGYGGMRLRERWVMAHRWVWEQFKGPIPDGLKVLHRCDTPRCVNYEDHLFLGTQADNVRDCMEKRRHAHGEGSAQAKLTEADVVEIRAAMARGEYYRDVAERFNIHCKYIFNIVNRKKWRHVE